MSVLPPLATSSDYVARYGALPDGYDDQQVDQMLEDISDQVREAAGWQQISLVTDDTVALRGNGRIDLPLPQRPVVDITAVDGLAASYWSHNGLGTLTRLDGRYWDGEVIVTYSHGYAVVPSWLVGICCQAVKRAANNDAGLRAKSTTIGGVTKSETYATETVNVPVMLTDDERDRISGAFRPGISTVAV